MVGGRGVGGGPLPLPLLGGPLLLPLLGGSSSTTTSRGSSSTTTSRRVLFYHHFWGVLFHYHPGGPLPLPLLGGSSSTTTSGGSHVTYPIMLLYTAIECPSASWAKFNSCSNDKYQNWAVWYLSVRG